MIGPSLERSEDGAECQQRSVHMRGLPQPPPLYLRKRHAFAAGQIYQRKLRSTPQLSLACVQGREKKRA